VAKDKSSYFGSSQCHVESASVANEANSVKIVAHGGDQDNGLLAALEGVHVVDLDWVQHPEPQHAVLTNEFADETLLPFLVGDDAQVFGAHVIFTNQGAHSLPDQLGFRVVEESIDVASLGVFLAALHVHKDLAPAVAEDSRAFGFVEVQVVALLLDVPLVCQLVELELFVGKTAKTAVHSLLFFEHWEVLFVADVIVQYEFKEGFVESRVEKLGVVEEGRQLFLVSDEDDAVLVATHGQGHQRFHHLRGFIQNQTVVFGSQESHFGVERLCAGHGYTVTLRHYHLQNVLHDWMLFGQVFWTHVEIVVFAEQFFVHLPVHCSFTVLQYVFDYAPDWKGFALAGKFLLLVATEWSDSNHPQLLVVKRLGYFVCCLVALSTNKYFVFGWGVFG